MRNEFGSSTKYVFLELTREKLNDEDKSGKDMRLWYTKKTESLSRLRGQGMDTNKVGILRF